MKNAPRHAQTWRNQEDSRRFSLAVILALRAALPRFLSAAVVFLSRASGVRCIREPAPAVVELDSLGLPRRALVEAVGIGIRGIPVTVKPVQTGFVVGDSVVARKLLSRCRPLKEPVAGPAGGEKGVESSSGSNILTTRQLGLAGLRPPAPDFLPVEVQMA